MYYAAFSENNSCEHFLKKILMVFIFQSVLWRFPRYNWTDLFKSSIIVEKFLFTKVKGLKIKKNEGEWNRIETRSTINWHFEKVIKKHFVNKHHKMQGIRKLQLLSYTFIYYFFYLTKDSIMLFSIKTTLASFFFFF